MNFIIEQALVFTCVAAIMCGCVFAVRWIITHVFHGRKQWSHGWYYFICWAATATFCCKFGLVGCAIGIICLYIGWNKVNQGKKTK